MDERSGGNLGGKKCVDLGIKEEVVAWIKGWEEDWRSGREEESSKREESE